MRKALFPKPSLPLVLFFALLFLNSRVVDGQTNYRIHPYLQVYENGKFQITWFANSPFASSIIIKDDQGTELLNNDVAPAEATEVYYTALELSQAIPGLENGSWLEGAKAYKYQITSGNLPPGKTLDYTVILGGEIFNSIFKTAPDRHSWEKIRFVALSDSETEPSGRVTHRTWYPGVPLVRPFTIPQLWKDKFGVSREQGLEIPHYMLSERDGYAENLKIINFRNPDFMLMPGDLVQGGGYQPGWDEFFRHNAGAFDKGLTRYPIIPAMGNWESFGGINGGYGFNEKNRFSPLVGRSRFHAYFGTPISDPLQKHQQSYYRADYGPVTILTLDSGNGTPDQKRSDLPEEQKIKGKQYTGPGTDTQENFTQAEYEANGGKDLAGFAPGTDQYTWLEHHLKDASALGQLIFVQFHHVPYSSGEHGVPMNHALSSGQGGTPLRIIHPLLEQYGVIAVLAGHDELFERSFVDEDGDGKGVHYYDVGVAGDGMRGEKRDFLNNPLSTLDYNSYKKWTADQNSPEIWNTTGSRPILEDGGKHYGHLEVNLEKVRENGNEYVKIRFSPVYSFPILDTDYNLLRVERRVYPDEIELKIPSKHTPSLPILKSSFTLTLDSTGAAKVKPEDLLTGLGSFQIGEFSVSKNQFDCQNLGLNSVKITAQKVNSTEKWTGEVQVNVLDTSPPTLVVKPFQTELDLAVGFVTLNANDFISEIDDNCGVTEISLDKTRVSCTEGGEPVEIEITAVDKSGNRVSKQAQLSVSVKESETVRISGKVSLCEGESTVLSLAAVTEFEVISWHRNGQIYNSDQPVAKTIQVYEHGTYHATIRYKGGCVSTSERKQIAQNNPPGGEITVNGGQISAPEGNFTYRWFRDGKLIAGATGRVLTITEGGEFTVELTDNQGCTTRLDPVAVIVLGLADALSSKGDRVTIYPNPSSGLTEVKMQTTDFVPDQSLKIYDLNGKDLTSMVEIVHSSRTGFVLDISRFLTGTYFLLLATDQQKFVLGRIIKK